MKKSIAIFGAGGLGKEILCLINAIPDWAPIGFYDDGLSKGSYVHGLPILGGTEELKKPEKPINLIVAIGDPSVKEKIVHRLKDIKQINFPTLLHPNSIVMDLERVTIGAGSVVSAGAIITTDVSIGRHVLININATLGHDCVLGDYSSVMPGVNLAGQVVVEGGVLIGAGASVKNGVKLGKGSTVGMGAVVLKEVLPGKTVAGVPAREI